MIRRRESPVLFDAFKAEIRSAKCFADRSFPCNSQILRLYGGTMSRDRMHSEDYGVAVKAKADSRGEQKRNGFLARVK